MSGYRTVEMWLNRQDVPNVVCLCGSTRFYQQFLEANYQETMKGNIVLSVGFYPHAQKEIHHEEKGCTPEQKIKLDELHKEKIRLADEVFVLNVCGYIGSSTRSEIEYAEKIGRPIRYLEDLPDETPASTQPATPTLGEDAWIDEIEQITCYGVRDKIRTILRAYRANLLSQPTLLESVAAKARGEALEQAAKVLDEEIRLREQFDEHMDSISELAAKIRALKP